MNDIHNGSITSVSPTQNCSLQSPNKCTMQRPIDNDAPNGIANQAEGSRILPHSNAAATNVEQIPIDQNGIPYHETQHGSVPSTSHTPTSQPAYQQTVDYSRTPSKGKRGPKHGWRAVVHFLHLVWLGTPSRIHLHRRRANYTRHLLHDPRLPASWCHLQMGSDISLGASDVPRHLGRNNNAVDRSCRVELS